MVQSRDSGEVLISFFLYSCFDELQNPVRIVWLVWHGVNGFGKGIIDGINGGNDVIFLGNHGFRTACIGFPWGL